MTQTKDERIAELAVIRDVNHAAHNYRYADRY